MSIDDCNGCRSEDCDACVTRRQHAKHEHCLDCRECLTDDNTSSDDGDRCKKCVPCHHDCGCDSEYEHDAAIEESRRDFLRNPGPPPAHWDDETKKRVAAAIECEHRKTFLQHYAGSDAAGKPISAAEWDRLCATKADRS